MTGSPKLSLPLQMAYEVANSSPHMVHASKAPKLQKRLQPDLDECHQAYFVELTTVGYFRDVERYVYEA